MLEDFFEEYKKYIVSLLFLSIFSLFYFSGDEKVEVKQILKDEYINHTDEEVSSIVYESEAIEEKIYEDTPKINIQEKVTKIETKANEIIETKIKETVLLSRTTEDNRYFIQLVSKVKLKSYEEEADFFIITGAIGDGYEESLFPMSVSENYLEDASSLILKIEDKKNNIKSICDGYFLDSLSKGFSYHIKVEFREEQSECYVIHQSDFVDENYALEEKKYVEIKDGVMGQLSDIQIKFTDKKEFDTQRINGIVE